MFAFGSFKLFPVQQGLFESDRPVALGGRAFALLLALVEHAGELASKETLLALLWPNAIVEECTLRSHLAAVRRALGCGRDGKRFIVTVSGRGYRFAVPVTRFEQAVTKAGSLQPQLPVRLTSLVGRQQEIERVGHYLASGRMVTITGPGGIGKTTVAVAVANALSKNYPDGVRLIELPPTADDAGLAAYVATQLGLGSSGESPASTISHAMRERRILLIFDGCEHVLPSSAALAEAILRQAPGVDLIATSREPLNADGEWEMRLGPLDTPPMPATLAAAELMAFPAVQLFVERAASGSNELAPGDFDLKIVSEICRRLDGNALAIELGAGQVATFGVQGLADLLGHPFLLQMPGRRTALRRHQSLRDTLDWSYQLLPAEQQWLLRQLSVVVGSLSLESCCAIAGPVPKRGIVIADLIARLVAKSLVSSDIGSNGPRFRLLDVTRVYAHELLGAEGEAQAALMRLASYLLAALDRPDITDPSAVGNLRLALDWAHSPAGSAVTALKLTLSAIPYWYRLGLIGECREWTERAIQLATVTPSAKYETMQLYAALAGILMNSTGAGPELAAAANRTLALANELDDPEHRLCGYWWLWVDRNNSGMHDEALEIAHLFAAAAEKMGDSSYVTAGNRMMGISLHFTGDQAGALLHLDRVLAVRALARPTSCKVPDQFDQRVAALCYKARVLLLMGAPEQAMRVAAESVAEAQATGHPSSLAYTLCEGACPVALATGNLEKAGEFVALLLDGFQQPGFELWRSLGQSYEAWLRLRKNEVQDRLALVRLALTELRSRQFSPSYTMALGSLAHALGRLGATAEGLEAIEDAFDHSQRAGDRWYSAELLRIKAELLVAHKGPNARTAALTLLHEARAEARRRGALAWELRVETSLVFLGEPATELAAVYGRFSEGYATDDLQTARRVLQDRQAHDLGSQPGRFMICASHTDDNRTDSILPSFHSEKADTAIERTSASGE
jgi:predicted ATPase/DNA-binding winged helix-turn-helix (wHTH) protein